MTVLDECSNTVLIDYLRVEISENSDTEDKLVEGIVLVIPVQLQCVSLLQLHGLGSKEEVKEEKEENSDHSAGAAVKEPSRSVEAWS